MAQLTEHVGFAGGITVQIADRSWRDPDFRSVVLQEPEFDALEPFLRAVEPSLHALWRYGVTDVSLEAAERLADALSGLDGADQADAEILQVLRMLGAWIKARLAEGHSIHVLGY